MLQKKTVAYNISNINDRHTVSLTFSICFSKKSIQNQDLPVVQVGQLLLGPRRDDGWMGGEVGRVWRQPGVRLDQPGRGEPVEIAGQAAGRDR